MPLDFSQVNTQLQAKWGDFQHFIKILQEEANSIEASLPTVFNLDYDALMAKLDTEFGSNGAIPSEEYREGLFVPFAQEFPQIPDMMHWAKQILQNKITTATDGSQIYSSQDYTIPVGLIQVAVFRNEHSPERSYIKTARVELLTPQDLMFENEEDQTIKFGQEPVDTRRFTFELEVLTDEMKEIGSRTPPVKHAMFFVDGSLVLSFMQYFPPELQQKHYDVLKSGFEIGYQYGYPLIGYVDSSDAKDVANMIAKFIQPGNKIRYNSDAAILERYYKALNKKPMKFGDRTCTFICDRNEPIYQNYPTKIGFKIAFFYIKLNSEQMARIEFPSWICDDPTLITEIANTIMAQVIIGSGYPYITDQCHHQAIIHAEERNKFHRLFQDFALKNSTTFRIKNKARSKVRRT